MKAWNLLVLPFGWLYGGAVALRNLGYDRGWLRVRDVGVPVVAIGNVTVGGTGKTPMAEFLLGKLLTMGFHPAYLSRGYGRKTKGYRLVHPDSGDAADFGDEAYQVASKFPGVPVAVCEDRVAGARQLQAQHPHDILVLDDAFQHRRIGRNLDLVMLDVSRLPFEDHLLPAGRLREPLRGLQRAHALVLTKYRDRDQAAQVRDILARRFPGKPVLTMDMLPRRVVPFGDSRSDLLWPTDLTGRRVVAFSGLGNNRHFEAMVRGCGVEMIAYFPFPDHHRYEAADLEKILSAFGQQPEIKGKFAPALILTTEKDYFRLRDLPWMQQHAALPWHYLEVGLEPVHGWEELEFSIKKHLSR